MPPSVLLLDVDHFKDINDTYGREVGDRALVHCAQIIENAIRTEDSSGRWGGEEFLILLPETPANGAEAMAERIRLAVESSPFEGPDVPVAFTVNIGMATLGAGTREVRDLLAAADKALYRCKAAGRNRSMQSDTFTPEVANLDADVDDDAAAPGRAPTPAGGNRTASCPSRCASNQPPHPLRSLVGCRRGPITGPLIVRFGYDSTSLQGAAHLS